MNESARPIEAGCKALITRGEGCGKPVRVGVFLGQRPYSPGNDNDWWEAKADGWSANGVIPICREICLMRIDDPEILEQIEEEEMVRVPSPYISTGKV